ncbi:MAG: FAD-dependent pyridine nucleotide-disulfide oxidoreductase, partial [Verrucomicrobiales bacterium]|nr:FAD-dependent pyridine nucleotide-disulfide oxidoreductase [Verrucomicrobiales bacterium]
SYGVRTAEMSVDWNAVQQRVQEVVAGMREMNRKNFTSIPKLDFILGTAGFQGTRLIEVRDKNGAIRRLAAEKIFINTGTRPATPTIPGLERVESLNSESVQRLPLLPGHLVVIGGGYVALEFAQMFRFLGSQVTVLEQGPQLLKNEDTDVAEALLEILRADGIDIRLNCSINRVEKSGSETAVICGDQNDLIRVAGSHLLIAAGRVPNTEELNLTAAGIKTNKRGFVDVNERLETSAPGVWALGDVNGGPQFTHASLDDYRIVKANVFDREQRATTDRLIPSTLFTEPELAHIGLTEKQAKQQNLAIRVAKTAVASIPRAKTMGETRGFIKVIADVKTDRILGCTILAAEAGEILGTVQMAMIAGLPFTALRDAVFSHPTLVEGFNTAFSGF